MAGNRAAMDFQTAECGYAASTSGGNMDVLINKTFLSGFPLAHNFLE